jgi:YjbE family integral membrane protein
MDIFSTAFLSALLAIIVIDLVLAGDNAIVIALAARRLPDDLRRKAIVWGTVGAIVVRTLMTLVVVWLLKIPGLLLIGGALLVFIAYKLIIDNESGDGHAIDGAQSFAGAIKTIVVADALMGLDNVLAVAGAAQGSFLLVVIGLLISIPIVVWGSQLILKFVVRYPVIVYVGSGVLAWTSVKMMLAEPLLAEWLAQYPAVPWIAYALVIGGVLLAGYLRNHAGVRAKVAAHVVEVAIVSPSSAAAAAGIQPGGMDMDKVLLPIDGSPNSLMAVQHVVNRFLHNPGTEVHLLHVRTPLSQHAARFLSSRTRAAWHRDEAEKALRPARELLDKFRVPYAQHVELGAKAQVIHRTAQRLHVNQIVMGTARKSSLTRMLEDSVTNQVLELAQVPVEVVAGQSVSPFERLAVPAGVGALLALVFVAAVD